MTEPDEPKISICMLAGHGIERLRPCLESLVGQVSAPPFELVVGGPLNTDITEVILSCFPAARLCHIGEGNPGAARNPLIERARGELLLFLDDDIIAPPDLLRQLARCEADHPGAAVFGGPNDTPPGSSSFEVVQGAVLSSLAGSGPVSRRYGARHAGPADERWFTLCNLAVRRRVMLPFLLDLVCAEENALLHELRRRGEKMHYEPNLRVFHARRSTPAQFAKQMFKYGRGRGQLLARQPTSFRVAYALPSAVLMYLTCILPLLLAVGTSPRLVVAPAALYAAVVLLSAGYIGATLRTSAAAPVAAALIVTLHCCYGVGVVFGLVTQARSTLHAAVRPERRDAESGYA